MAKNLEIYHNPRCSKSRATLELIRKNGIEPKIVLYLEHTLTKNKLKEILKKLNMRGNEIVRKSEPIYKIRYKGQKMSEEKVIDAILEYPILLERPIVVSFDRAIIGRPPENVKALF